MALNAFPAQPDAEKQELHQVQVSTNLSHCIQTLGGKHCDLEWVNSQELCSLPWQHSGLAATGTRDDMETILLQ